MLFPLLVHTGQAMLDVLPGSRLDSMTRSGLLPDDRLAASRQLPGFQKLEPPATPHRPSTHRIRAGR